MALIIIFSLALQGSLLSALSPDDIKDELYEYCPLNNFANRSGDELRSNTTFRPCCVSCVTTDCGVRAPCCPDDRITEMTSNCTEISYSMSQNPVGLEFNPLTYWMVGTCDPAFQDTLEEFNCLSRRIDDPFNVSFIQPVIDSNTKIIYANKYCAVCNGVSHKSLMSDFFQPSVKCSFYEKTFVSSPLKSLEQSLLDGQCVHFFEPMSFEFVYESRCFQVGIDKCNVTGLWEVYDPVIEEACVSYDMTMLYYYAGNYKNIHCFLCNEQFHWFYDPICTDEDSQYSKDRGYMAILTADRATSNLQLSSNLCPITDFWDPKKKRCRDIICPGTKIQTENGCASLLTSMKNIQWSINILWIIPAYKSSGIGLHNLTDWMTEYAFEYIDTNLYSKFKDVTPLRTLIYTEPTPGNDLWVFAAAVFEHSRDADDDPAIKFIKDFRYSRKDQMVFNVNGVNVVINNMLIGRGNFILINFFDTNVLVFDKILLQQRIFTHGKPFLENDAFVASITWSCDLVVLDSDEFSLALFDSLIVTRSGLHLSPVEYVIDYETMDVLICVEDLLYEGPSGSEMRGVTTSKLLTGLSYGTTIVSMLSIMLVLLAISLNIQRTFVSKLIVGLYLSVVLSQGLQLSSQYVNEDDRSCELLGLLAHFFQINSAAWLMVNVVQHVRSKTDLSKTEKRDCSKRFLLLSLLTTTMVPSIFVAANIGLSMEVLGSESLGYGGNYCAVVSLPYIVLFSLLPTVFPILFSLILLAWKHYRSLDAMTDEADGKRNIDDKFYIVFSFICLFYWLLKFLSVWFKSDDFVNVAMVINLAKGMWIFWSIFPFEKKLSFDQ